MNWCPSSTDCCPNKNFFKRSLERFFTNQIDAYIRDHSQAEFSHGVCPECAKKLYFGNIYHLGKDYSISLESLPATYKAFFSQLKHFALRMKMVS